MYTQPQFPLIALAFSGSYRSLMTHQKTKGRGHMLKSVITWIFVFDNYLFFGVSDPTEPRPFPQILTTTAEARGQDALQINHHQLYLCTSGLIRSQNTGTRTPHRNKLACAGFFRWEAGSSHCVTDQMAATECHMDGLS